MNYFSAIIFLLRFHLNRSAMNKKSESSERPWNHKKVTNLPGRVLQSVSSAMRYSNAHGKSIIENGHPRRAEKREGGRERERVAKQERETVTERERERGRRKNRVCVTMKLILFLNEPGEVRGKYWTPEMGVNCVSRAATAVAVTQLESSGGRVQ